MKHKTGKMLLSWVIALVMVVGLLPGMSLTAYAAEETINSKTDTLNAHGITNINYGRHVEFGDDNRVFRLSGAGAEHPKRGHRRYGGRQVHAGAFGAEGCRRFH